MRTTSRTAAVTLGLAAGGLAIGLLAPAANAQTNLTQTLTPGQKVCITASPSPTYQIRANGSATGAGAHFQVKFNGTVIGSSYDGHTVSYAAEYRTSFGNFPGRGTYQLCAADNNTTNTKVTLQFLTDAELG
jgi:hypothetical protein